MKCPAVLRIPLERSYKASRGQQLKFTRFRHEDRIWADGRGTAITC